MSNLRDALYVWLYGAYCICWLLWLISIVLMEVLVEIAEHTFY